MTKQDQIAEMMALITTAKLKDGHCNVSSIIDYYARQLAEKLYDGGYRKIDGDDYVSREWHDEQMLHAEGEIERLRTKLQQVLLSVDTVKERNTMATIDEHRKQAVKEFAEKLKAKAFQCYQVGMYIVDTETIDATAKKYFEI